MCMHKLVLNLFYFYICFFLFLARQSGGQFKGVELVRPASLYEWKITPAHPILTNKFKNILRTFDAESLKIFRNNQPQLKN